MTTLNLQVGVGEGDANEAFDEANFNYTGVLLRIDSHTEQDKRYVAGFRFIDATIPSESTINTATLDLFVYSTSYDDPNVDIYAEDVDDAVDFSTTPDVYTRYDLTRTAASSPWVDTGVGGGWETSPDFAAVIKEVVDRGGWDSGNALVILVAGKNEAPGDFIVRTYEYGEAAKLDIDYTAGGVTTRRYGLPLMGVG